MAAHDEARRLDPNVPTSVAYTLFLMGDYERLARSGDTILDYEPQALGLLAQGRREEALARARRLRSTPLPHVFPQAADSMRAYITRDKFEWAWSRRRRGYTPTRGPVPDRNLLWRGHTFACGFPSVAVRRGYFKSLPIRRDPLLEPLRFEPGFEALIDAVEAGRLTAQKASAWGAVAARCRLLGGWRASLRKHRPLSACDESDDASESASASASPMSDHGTIPSVPTLLGPLLSAAFAVLGLTLVPATAEAVAAHPRRPRSARAAAGPALSPDGKNVALVVGRGNLDENRHDRELVQVDVATGAQKVLLRDRRGLRAPRFSPAGDAVAFLAEGEGKTVQLHVLAGEDPRTLTATRAGSNDSRGRPTARPSPSRPPTRPSPRTARSGSRTRSRSGTTASSTAPPRGRIPVDVPATGGEARRVTGGGFSLATSLSASPLSFSPDGRFVAFTRTITPRSGDTDSARVHVADVATGLQHRITLRRARRRRPRSPPTAPCRLPLPARRRSREPERGRGRPRDGGDGRVSRGSWIARSHRRSGGRPDAAGRDERRHAERAARAASRGGGPPGGPGTGGGPRRRYARGRGLSCVRGLRAGSSGGAVRSGSRDRSAAAADRLSRLDRNPDAGPHRRPRVAHGRRPHSRTEW